jgi:hypothetical protein
LIPLAESSVAFLYVSNTLLPMYLLSWRSMAQRRPRR